MKKFTNDNISANKYRVGVVSYLNSRPLIYGLYNTAIAEKIILTEDTPAKLLHSLLNDEIDIGLIPVAGIPQIKNAEIVSDYCIAADSEVASVALFSQVPLSEIETIYLDYQSRTSVMLLKILCKEYWKISPTFISTQDDNYFSLLKNNNGLLIIGDRALQNRQSATHIYDLAIEWKNFTELPFVFAAWVSNKKIDEKFIKEFNIANEYGFGFIDEVVKKYNYETYDLKKYFTSNIVYKLDEEKMKGLNLFLQKLTSQQWV